MNKINIYDDYIQLLLLGYVDFESNNNDDDDDEGNVGDGKG